MNMDELYKAKGQLTTEIEIAQAKLQQVNKLIIDSINQQAEKKAEASKGK